jgi:putative copper resistance protein D
LLLGTPVALALQAFTPSSRRRVLLPVLHSRPVTVLRSPLFGWATFAVVIWGTHYSPVYEAALRSETVHALEHLAYLAAGLLFWWPVVGLDPSPARLSHPGRLLYLFLSMPVMALLGLAIFNSGHILYSHYSVTSGLVGISALADQHLAGALMWEGGMFVVVPALGFVLWSWMNRDEREAARADARARRAGPAGVADAAFATGQARTRRDLGP